MKSDVFPRVLCFHLTYSLFVENGDRHEFPGLLHEVFEILLILQFTVSLLFTIGL